MNFTFSEEHRMVQEMVRNFVDREVRPVATGMDRQGLFPRDLVKRMGELGLMGAFIPAEAGGSGLDLISYVIAVEEISKVWASLGVILSVNNSLICHPIHRFGTQEQKERFLKPLAQGKRLGCYALTEAGAGSDAGSIRTVARKNGKDYILNGSKLFITNGREADVALVYAVTNPDRGKKGISAFLVEKGTPGFEVGKIEDKMGLRSSDTAELIFRDCSVPADQLLGEENEGFRIALATLEGGRIGIAAQALGIAQGCLEESVRYAKEREQFGQPIGNFQSVQWMLADLFVELEAARWMTYSAASLRQAGKKASMEASMAKLLASEAANRAAYRGVQIFGGYGYMKAFPVERFFRDARITTLYEGTSEIQRLVIARELLN